MNIEELEKIISILKTNEVTEFELQQDGTHIKLCRGSAQLTQAVGGVSLQHVQPAISHYNVAPAAVSSGAPVAVSQVAEVPSNLVKVESPIVGTFYRKPGPDKDNFVSIGSVVKKGDTLCIVEAMKLMNEIEAPASGKIEKILLEDGQVVEYGEVLFLINPNA